MMYAVCEPNSLQINFESQPIWVVLVAIVVCIDGFQRFPQLQAITTILVPKNVPSKQRSLGKIVNKKFLTKWKFFKSRHFVAQQLNVGKTLVNWMI